MNINTINFSMPIKQMNKFQNNNNETTDSVTSVNYSRVPGYCYAANAITFGNKNIRAISPKIFNNPHNLSDVSGMENIKTELTKIVNNVLDNKGSSSGALLYGPAGNGKTFITEALSQELQLPLYKVNIQDVGGVRPRKLKANEIVKRENASHIDWQNQLVYEDNTFHEISDIYNQLAKSHKETGEKSILMFDDADAIFKNMKDSDKELITKILDEAPQNGIVPVFTTSNINEIDSAITKHLGLKKIEVTKPNYEQRFEIIKDQLSKCSLTKNLAEDNELIAKLSETSADFPISAITSSINNGLSDAIMYSANKEQIQITGKDLITAMENLPMHLKH